LKIGLFLMVIFFKICTHCYQFKSHMYISRQHNENEKRESEQCGNFVGLGRACKKEREQEMRNVKKKGRKEKV
jgi:hypothetical protein